MYTYILIILVTIIFVTAVAHGSDLGLLQRKSVHKFMSLRPIIPFSERKKELYNYEQGTINTNDKIKHE
jgi:hypothetical protein